MGHVIRLYVPRPLEDFPNWPARLEPAELEMLVDGLELCDADERRPGRSAPDLHERLSGAFEAWNIRAARDRCVSYGAPPRLLAALGRWCDALGDDERDLQIEPIIEMGERRRARADETVDRLSVVPLECIGMLGRSMFNPARGLVYQALEAEAHDGGVSGDGAIERYTLPDLERAIARAGQVGDGSELGLLERGRRAIADGAEYVLICFS